MNRRLWTRAVLSLPFFALLGARRDETIDPPSNLPLVRVSIGMSTEELRRGSTYSFGAESSVRLIGGFQSFQITEPFNLVFEDSGAELKLNNLGGQREATHIVLSRGYVDRISVTVQNGKTNLHNVIEQAKTIYNWFSSHGYEQSEAPKFVVVRRNGTKESDSIVNFAQAEAAFLDSSIKIEEMGMFGFTRGGIRVGVSLHNGRRARAKQNKDYDDESNAKEEACYMLILYITEIIKPYDPSSPT